jgi:hypothetical protein
MMIRSLSLSLSLSAGLLTILSSPALAQWDKNCKSYNVGHGLQIVCPFPDHDRFYDVSFDVKMQNAQGVPTYAHMVLNFDDPSIACDHNERGEFYSQDAGVVNFVCNFRFKGGDSNLYHITALLDWQNSDYKSTHFDGRPAVAQP